LIAALLMTPLLGVLCTLAGILGGYVVMASLGYTSTFYITEVYRAVDYIDVLQGLFKSAVFAFLVCAIGCLRGLRTASGPGAVGDSTTRAVVAGIILVIVADGILGVVFYFVGI
jgi:phospholipid/cholesterol/gamma-HCH transport system permease protein